MKWISISMMGLVLSVSFACSSPEKRAYRAQEEVHKERLRLVDEYKKCLDKAGGDNEKIEACDRYLKAAESLK